MNKQYFRITLLFLFCACLTIQTQAAPGDLDLTFGTNGTVVTGTPINPQYPRDVAIQNDGKIVVLGRKVNLSLSRTGFIVVRYNSNGTLDTTFDGDGAVTTDVSRNLFSAESVVIQNDGKILVAGRLDQIVALGNYQYNWVFVRYNSNGSLDTTFNGNGILETTIASPNGGKLEVLPLGNGKFYAVGSCRFDYTLLGSSGTVSVVCVTKFNADGSKDITYNEAGTAIVPYSYPFAQTRNYRLAYADSAVLQADGKIVIVNHVNFGPSIRTAVTRLDSNGVPDNSFGTGPEGNLGWNYVKIRDSGIPIEVSNDMAIQPDGKFVTVGNAYSTCCGNPSDSVFFALRFDSNGFLDNSFDSDGIVTTEIRLGRDEAFSVVLQPNGKIILSGITTQDNPIDIDSAFVRYNSDGSLDNSFGTNGIAIRDLGTYTVGARAAALQSDGKLIVVGNAFTYPVFTIARILTDSTTIQNRVKFDFDGDGKADIGIFRPAPGEWWYLRSSDGANRAVQFGSSTDKIVPADFTGDGKTDLAFFRPSSGEWFIVRSEDSSFYSFPFGGAGDIPAPGDFDGDGKADPAVFRPSNSTWYILKSSGGTTIQQFGIAEDIPQVADYDGDGKADLAVFRPTSSEWWINGSASGVRAFQFGQTGDKAVPADYTGDGKTDVAVWRPSNGSWFILRSENSSFYSFPFGSSGDQPAPGDYDGDGKADAAVFRNSNLTWYLNQTTNGSAAIGFGANGDKPLAAAFVP